MKLSNIRTIFSKEIKDTLRDRRTLVFMLLIPIVAIPVLVMLLPSLMMSQIRKVEEEKATVVIEGKDHLPEELRRMFEESSRLTVGRADDYAGDDLKAFLRRGEFEALVVVADDFAVSIDDERPGQIEIYFDKAELKSEFAEGKVRDILDKYKEAVVAGRIDERNISADILDPFSTTSHNVARPQKMAGESFGRFLPYIIIIMCFMGAMYPAIDLAAGEKERGTLETLLISPATKGEVVIGKYGVILLTGIVAAFLSFGSLLVSLNHMSGNEFRMMSELLAIEFDLRTIALMFLIILPMAGIFAAVLLSISIFSRSFKEAQNYITALNMLIILPAFVSLLPGVELTARNALIPIVNASLILKEAISGSIQWEYVFIALVSNLVIAVVALVIAKKWFEREAVLFRM